MIWGEDFFIITLTALIIATNCSIIGTYLILRKQSMVGDAISHTVLLGIVVAFLITGKFSGLAFTLGALGAALLTSFCIEFLRSRVKINEDASIGITFTSFFALGIFLLVRYAPNADLDTHCILFGSLVFTPLESKISLGPFLSLPHVTVKAMASLIFVSFCCRLLHKEFLLCAFHENLAKSMGIPTRFLQYFFYALLSLAVVFALQSVGAILVIAFLVIPVSSARLLARSFKEILLYSLLINILIVPIGVYLAFLANLNISATIVVVHFVVFLLLVLLSILQRSSQPKNIAVETPS